MDVDMETQAESSGCGGDNGEWPPQRPPIAHHHLHENQLQLQQWGDLRASIKGMLVTAEQLLNDGKPSLALQAVMAAIKARGGDMAVFEALHRARELYQNKLQSSTATDELSSLFARCMIHEAEPSLSSRPEIAPFFNDNGHVATAARAVAPDLEETMSILAESGRKDIVIDAFMDGSSFVCLQCGGLVSNLRKDEHLAHWCSGKR